MCDMIDSQSAEKISRMKKLRRTLSESFGRIGERCARTPTALPGAPGRGGDGGGGGGDGGGVPVAESGFAVAAAAAEQQPGRGEGGRRWRAGEVAGSPVGRVGWKRCRVGNSRAGPGKRFSGRKLGKINSSFGPGSAAWGCDGVSPK